MVIIQPLRHNTNNCHQFQGLLGMFLLAEHHPTILTEHKLMDRAPLARAPGFVSVQVSISGVLPVLEGDLRNGPLMLTFGV